MAWSSPTGKKKLVLVVVAATLMLQQRHSSATDGTGNSSLAKPGCVDKCGNVSIPYPFGIGDKGCFREGFEVECQPDNVAALADSSDKIIPLLEVNLSLGEARVQSNVARSCNFTSSEIEDMDTQSFSFGIIGSSFTVSGAKNKFTAIGCATVASIMRGPDESSVTSACGSFCYQEDSIDNGTRCFGRGCCQSPIPENINSFTPAFLRNVGNTRVQNFSPCSYAFVAEEGSFEFDPSYAKSDSFDERYKPRLVLDWVVGQVTCAEAMKQQLDAGSTTYACASTNSVCIDVPGRGYRCSCPAGYDGNPYLDGGCQDIDECRALPQPCTKDGQCSNTNGSYTCTCPRGTHSDDAKSLPCTPTDDNGPNKTVIGISVGLICLFVAIFTVLSACRKRKLAARREDFQLVMRGTWRVGIGNNGLYEYIYATWFCEKD